MAVPAFFVEREKKGFTNSLGLLDQTMSTKFRLIDFRLTFLILKRKFNCFSVCNFGSKPRIIFLLVFNFSNAQTVLGKWKTVDKNGVSKCVVQIFEKDGKVYGEIVEVLIEKEKNAVCKKCVGDEKDKPYLGLTLIKNLEK